MNTEYSLSAVINCQFSFEAVSSILKKGLDIGFIYYANPSERSIDVHVLDTQTAANRLLDLLKNNAYQHTPAILAKIDDTKFGIKATSTDTNLINISFSSFFNAWIRDCSLNNDTFEPYFDLCRYSRLMLKLCSSFSIVKFSTELNKSEIYAPLIPKHEIYINLAKQFTPPHLEKYKYIEQTIDNYEIELPIMLGRIQENIIANKILLFEDEFFTKPITFSSEKASTTLHSEKPVIFFAKAPIIPYEQTQEIFFKILIESQWMILMPLQPLYTKKIFGQNAESFDFTPYIKIGIELCSNLPVSEIISGREYIKRRKNEPNN